jgi:uncharacterized membrane protein YfcA
MDIFFLVAASLFTSALTAIVGMGGGMLLISLMPSFLPIAAVVPVHGAVQIASNASRVLFGLRHVEWRIFWPFFAGSVIGAALGSPLVLRLPSEHMPLLLGLFILVFTWLPKRESPFRLPGHFAIMGAVQTFLSLFVGVSGPLTNAFLLREELPRDRLVVTHGMLMTATHALKILAFGLMGFAFAPHLTLIAAMVVAVSLGSYAGTFLLGRVPEALFRKILKALITVLALRMIARVLFGEYI